MKCTTSWLEQFVSLQGHTPQQIADRLTMLGLEVDGVEELHAGLDALITAKVLEVSKHPDADKLSVCRVDTGSETIQVVCGAPNVRAGMVSALALPGVVMPNGDKLKKTKMRGVESQGMLCSARELGLSTDHSGIMDLDANLALGLPLRQALGLADAVIEVDLTPNRADCASIMGIAREIAGFTGGSLKPLVDAVTPLTGKDAGFTVTIEEPELCPRYAARKLTGFKIGPSPDWMQQRLLAVGMRPINNIVDITNYVMLESGQPLHAFDFGCLAGQTIVVRRPRPGETELVTLDGNTRKLDADTLLICDAQKPVALAGVMGGLDSEITDKTTTLLLESACFNPVSIRRTARRLGIPSEASYRFERGVDPNLADKALERAAQLMAELAGAVPAPDGIDQYPGKKEPLVLSLRMARLNTLLGREVAEDEAARLLSGIGFGVRRAEPGRLEVTVPSFRVDVEREVDLVEEVARLIGYDSIPATRPLIRMDSPEEEPMRALRRAIGRNLTAQGFFEAINYSFVNPAHHDQAGLAPEDPRRRCVRLLNPLSEEQSTLRTLLLPGLLENIARNLNFQQADIRLFETGKVFWPKAEGEQPEERMRLCAVMSGGRYPHAEPLHFAGQKADFADIKGALAHLLWHLGRPLEEHGGDLRLAEDETSRTPYADPTAHLALFHGDAVIGHVAEVAPNVRRAFDIKQTAHFLEIDLDALLAMPQKGKKFFALPRYPSTSRDVNFVVDKGVAAGELLAAAKGLRQKYVETIQLVDIYEGDPLSKDEKSVSLSITYRSPGGTLDDATVDKAHSKIVQALMGRFNARHRERQEG